MQGPYLRCFYGHYFERFSSWQGATPRRAKGIKAQLNNVGVYSDAICGDDSIQRAGVGPDVIHGPH